MRVTSIQNLQPVHVSFSGGPCLSGLKAVFLDIALKAPIRNLEVLSSLPTRISKNSLMHPDLIAANVKVLGGKIGKVDIVQFDLGQKMQGLYIRLPHNPVLAQKATEFGDRRQLIEQPPLEILILYRFSESRQVGENLFIITTPTSQTKTGYSVGYLCVQDGKLLKKKELKNVAVAAFIFAPEKSYRALARDLLTKLRPEFERVISGK